MAKTKKITETGPKGLKGLKGVNAYVNKHPSSGFTDEERQDLLRRYQSSVQRNYWGARGRLGQDIWLDDAVSTRQHYTPDLPEFNYGDSSYDNEGILYNMSPATILDNRAESQSWYAKIGAGLAKGAILAGTTFLDGTVGLIAGLAESANRGDWSGLWDNDFSKTMQEINKWSEEALPNYYSVLELNTPWYENIFTANFWGDKFLKNLGFTIGAFYSGGLEAAGIKGLGALAKNIAKGTKMVLAITKATPHVASAIGAFTSAVNEGRIEALNNSTDWYQLKVDELNQQFLLRELLILEEYENSGGGRAALLKYDLDMNALNLIREQSLAKLNEDRLHMGNTDLAMNLPILLASNIVQFGKLYANGFKTAKKGLNITGGPGNYGSGTSRFLTTARAFKGALSEGAEEISQSAASRISGNYYSKDVNNFVKAKLDPQASLETLDWTKEFALGIAETLGEGSSWEEFFIGSLTGALGMPRFRGFKDANGNLQSPITIEGGMINEIRESNKAKAEEQELADRMNARFASPEFKNYYQGLIRHKKYQNDMDNAAERDDPFDFHNAEHAQMISDIIMFDKAGKLLDLRELIDSSYDTSDENLASIVKNTTSQTLDGKTVGPFIDENGNPMYSTEEGKQEMINKLTENKDLMKKAIKQYQEIKNDIQARLPNNVEVTDDQLEELVWMKSQIENWGERATEMSGEIKNAIGKVIGSLESSISLFTDIRNKEGQDNADLTPTYRLMDSSIRKLQKAVNTLSSIRNLDDATLARTLSNNPEFVKGLIDEINNIEELHMTDEDKQDVKQKLEDIIKLGNGQLEYLKKYKEYVINPYLLTVAHGKILEDAEKEEQNLKTQGLRENLTAATNLNEFKRALLDEEDLDPLDKEDLIKELADSGNEVAKNYIDTLDYANLIRRELTNSSVDSDVFDDAMTLFQAQLSNSNNLQEISNLDSIHLTDPTFFDDDSANVQDSLDRFRQAQAALLAAMQRVNESASFKNRFNTPETLSQEENGQQAPQPLSHSQPLQEEESSVGDISQESLVEENNTLNNDNYDSLDLKPSGDKKYWRPVIPLLHIEASKEGDFRPWNVVVKEREDGVNFDTIYEHLESNGAFDYVNLGNLKATDTIYFVIDPSFESKVEGNEWHKNPTVFIAVKKPSGEYQLVGSLDEGGSVLNFPGLERVEKIVRDDYNRNKESQDTSNTQLDNPVLREASDEFKEKIKDPNNWESIDVSTLSYKECVALEDVLMPILADASLHDAELVEKARKTRSTEFVNRLRETSREYTEAKDSSTANSNTLFIGLPTTRVSQIMLGKIPTTNEDRNLADIPNIKGPNGNQEPVFAIVKNGRLTTNGKISANKIINPMNMANKEGRLYLLIPNAAGTYSPMAVRVKHFNNSEFNLDDPTILSTPMGEEINLAINDLANAKTSDLIQDPKKSLVDNIYMRDVMITWFSNNQGSGIVISKKVRDANGHPVMVNINGQLHIKEEKSAIYFSSPALKVGAGGIIIEGAALNNPGALGWLDASDNPVTQEFRDPNDIKKEIINVLSGYNLPLQVSARKINNRGYNNRLLSSNILTSNLASAEMLSSWFTMDYIDENGNIQKAENPPSVLPPNMNPLNPPEAGSERGLGNTVQINLNGNNLEINLLNNTIRLNGKWRNATTSDLLLLDLAWALSVYGSNTEGLNLHNNCVITPNGLVLNRSTLKYLEGDEAQHIKDVLEGKARTKELVDRRVSSLLNTINNNLKLVDKDRTDSEYYYILEEDGNYYPYDRIHKRLGSNWKLSRKLNDSLNRIRNKLQENASDVNAFNKYLDNLGRYWKVDLSQFKNNLTATNRAAIVLAIQNKMSTPNLDSLDAGQSVDTVIRQYFMLDDVSKIVKPDNMTLKAFNLLMDRLSIIKQLINNNGWRFLTNNIVLFHKYADGTRIAGEVDILAIDSQGVFHIIDIKTSRWPFGLFLREINGQTVTVNYFENPSDTMVMSSKDYYTLQLSGYLNLFMSLYLENIGSLALLPFTLSYEDLSKKGLVTNITAGASIPLRYNPSVNVPIEGDVKAQQPTTLPLLPVSQPQLPTLQRQSPSPVLPVQPAQNPQTLNPTVLPNSNVDPALLVHDNILSSDMLSEHNKFTTKDNKEGYYIVGGRVHKGYLISGGQINGKNIYIAREANMTSEHRDTPQVGTYDYYAVFSNGESVPVMKSVSPSVLNEDLCITAIMSALRNNPGRVDSISAKENVLTKDNVNDVVQPLLTLLLTNLQQNTPQSTGALSGISKASPATKRTRPKLREATSLNIPVWDLEKELSQLRRMLPQLTRLDAIRIINGLIKVAEGGEEAWGKMEDGVITISDIAAEGTAYHEGFHLVFNHMMNELERQALLKEARQKYGANISDAQLEEELAEDFREFVMSDGLDNRSLGRKILDFFKSLLALVNNWSKIRPSSTYYFRAIYNGKYANKKINKSNTDTKYQRELYTPEMLNILTYAPRDAQGRLLAPNGKPSNLTERQYAHVRTKAFKEWFGDWEKYAKLNNATVIWGHPASGKTYLFKQGRKDIIDFDSEYKVRINKIMGLPEGADAKELRKAARNARKQEYHDLIMQLFDEAKAEAKRTGKKLLVSDMMLLREREADIDVITNMSDERFIERSAMRGETDADNKMLWKNDINDAMSKASDKSKIINTEDFILDDLYGTNVSKVVDENGEPLVVYHSSPNIFNTFELEKSPNGFYFGTREQAFARLDMEVDYHPTGLTVQAFLNIKNPKITTFDDRSIQKYKDTNDGFIIEVSREDAEELAKIGDYNPDNFRKEYVAFDSNQVKSATDNVGTYSRYDNDIRYRRVIGNKVLNWNLLNAERKRLLEKLGWTEEYFNRISQEERDHRLRCLA